MQRAPISFVIAAYNDAAGVRRHLDYFTRAGQPAELIIVDDASTDGLEKVVAGAELPDGVRLRYHRNSENRGPGPTRNTGLEMASEERLMFLDADDLLVPEFFDYIALSPLRDGADFVLFKYHLSRSAEDPLSYAMLPPDGRFFSGLELCSFPDRAFRLEEVPGVVKIVNFPWNKVYRTGFLREAGIRFPDLRIHEDIRHHWQSCLRAVRFGILNWAPPLIQHFEAHVGARATNYIGPQRQMAFETMMEVLEEISRHPLATQLIPELVDFAEDLLAWMIRQAPDLAEMMTLAAEELFIRLRRASGDPQRTI